MSDDAIQDLKQFISVTVRQETSSIRDDIIARLDKKIDGRTDEILSAITETTNNRFEHVESDISRFNTRVSKLEASAS